jgi:hypothetical protein
MAVIVRVFEVQIEDGFMVAKTDKNPMTISYAYQNLLEHFGVDEGIMIYPSLDGASTRVYPLDAVVPDKPFQPNRTVRYETGSVVDIENT